MKHFLCIYNNDTRVGRSRRDVLRAASVCGLDSAYVLSEDISGLVSLFVWSNEGDTGMVEGKDFTVAVSGYIGGGVDCLRKSVSGRADMKRVVSGASGLFSVLFVDKAGPVPRVYVYNTITRIVPVYYTTINGMTIVSTSALLLHLVSTSSRTPQYAIENLVPFLSTGYYNSESTPYLGVKVAPANSEVIVNEEGVSVERIDDILRASYTTVPDTEYYDELAHKFISALSHVKEYSSSIRCGITGGKDSRLIVAGLKYAGVNFETYTSGFDEHPDVVIGKEISKILRLKHSTNRPSAVGVANGGYLEYDLSERVRAALVMNDGMMSGYENFEVVKVFKDEVVLGGHGGELLRGGFAKTYSNNTKPSLDRFVRSLTGVELLRDEYITVDRRRNQATINGDIEHLRPIDILDKYYLNYRCGRWSATARSAYLRKSHIVQPFFDNALIKHVIKSRTEYKLDDRMIYEIIKRLSPQLIDVPFASDRWKFEKEDWLLSTKRRWKNRNIKIDNYSPRASFNWRMTATTQMREAFKAELLDNEEGSGVFQVIDKAKVEEVLGGNAKGSAKTNLLLWHALTAKHLVSNRWINSPDKKDENIVRVYIGK